MIVGSLPTTMAEYRKALAAAYAEGRGDGLSHGRQQAAALLDAVSGYFDAVDQERSPAEVYQKETTLRRAWESALHLQRVAGLNASESAPKPEWYCFIREPHEHDGVASTGPCWRNPMYRDASESGQPHLDGCIAASEMEIGHWRCQCSCHDASESGQPPEASFLENVAEARENGYDRLCAHCGVGVYDESDMHDRGCPEYVEVSR